MMESRPQSKTKQSKVNQTKNQTRIGCLIFSAFAFWMSQTQALACEQGKPCTLNLKGAVLELAWIPPGEFMMGCSPDDPLCNDAENPAHKVKLEGFWMGKYEVTQGQWRAVMGYKNDIKGDRLPAVAVSWSDALGFLEKAGNGLSLPTETQWEYAARGGVTASRYGDLDAVAWYDKNSDKKLHPVGEKEPNAYGLYDMLGNVWEWCQDDWKSYAPDSKNNPGSTSTLRDRVYRGGSAMYDAWGSRASFRYHDSTAFRDQDLGFRVVRNVR